jgi:GT2 family glycosyltransferase
VSPSASVVIPVHGRAALTRRCLETVLATVAPETEIVVVDDASPDETPEMLAAFGDAIQVVTLPANAGFATACNRGAAAASGELIAFLNNDTEPQSGWLDALLDHARAHPEADVVGAKLLYPTGDIQHAGVVFGQDGYPHHLYAGLPADLPAANRSRRLQAVTGACALVRRAAFEAAGGFDAGFHNSLEDVDLCLRIGEGEGEVHYCHEAVVDHLESASRGRSDRFEASVALYRERWRDRVRRDDLETYAADGLITVEYADSYPVRMSLSPQLAIVARDREEEIERLLEAYARQVSDLLGEVVRLTAGATSAARDVSGDPLANASGYLASTDHERLLARARQIETEIEQLQREAEPSTGVAPGPRLGYRALIDEIRAAVSAHVRPGATVLVISRGDRELVRLDSHAGGHFPQDAGGEYLGHHPTDSSHAIALLEQLREQGAEYLVIPATASWWLTHYAAFATHLHERYTRVASGTCAIYDLAIRPQAASRNTMPQ